ncbi:heavy metal-binding protein HIP-like [Dreissena polymorpha]|uniref:C1q domain-containing protein n=1 Tax=Dreissena polymorpha TaxID=45954 RepID=A0A9D4LZX6_DREPO|nr:heavy metal-binding protein HIP-like [Dreissena polymorpha]KAH3866799.1 hypothetical protein DPMN_029922 [Dreissena polymorpha]
MIDQTRNGITVLLVIGLATTVQSLKHDKTKSNTKHRASNEASTVVHRELSSHEIDLLHSLIADLRQHFDQHSLNKRVEPSTKRRFGSLRGILSNGDLKAKTQYNKFDEKLIEMPSKIDELESSLQKVLAIHQNNPEKRARQSEPQVAFYAQLTQDPGPMGLHQTVVFDNVVTNIGNAYNKFSGMFTAPVSGTYVIFWSTFNRDRTHFPSELVHNANVAGQAWSDAYDHNDGAMASNQAVLQMNAGDIAYIREGTFPQSAISHGNSMTSFSGLLLYSA